MKKIKGIWSIINNQNVIEIFSQSNFDFIIFDMEHGNFNKKDIEKALSYCQNNNTLGIARIPIDEKGNIQAALDSGCDGIIFPRIETVEEARKCIQSCSFTPNGTRGFNPFTRFNSYNINKNKILKKKILKIIMIESKRGIENLESIISLPGIDVIYFGIFDLSKDLNLKVTDLKIQKIINENIKKCKKNNIEIGLMDLDENSKKLCKKFNIKFILKDVDTNLIVKATQKIN